MWGTPARGKREGCQRSSCSRHPLSMRLPEAMEDSPMQAASGPPHTPTCLYQDSRLGQVHPRGSEHLPYRGRRWYPLGNTGCIDFLLFPDLFPFPPLHCSLRSLPKARLTPKSVCRICFQGNLTQRRGHGKKCERHCRGRPRQR